MAVLPERHADRAKALCTEMFGERFELSRDLLSIALGNVNPQNHMAIALCNLTRIELGETWGQNAKLTPSVGRLIEGLDRERLAVAERLGSPVGSIFDFFSNSFGVRGDTVSDIAAQRTSQGNDPFGPRDATTRYILEDVPFGLVPTLYLASLCGVPVPLHSHGVGLLSACYGRDFATDNDLLPEFADLDLATLKRLSRDGYANNITAVDRIDGR